MANYYTYGSIPDAEETVYGPLSQRYAYGGEVGDTFLNESAEVYSPRSLAGMSPYDRAQLLDQYYQAPSPPPSSSGSSSAPTWYRWSDGTYNRNPESTGIRTPYSELPDQYKQIDSRRPSTTQPAAEGPSGLSSLPSQELPVTKPEISGLIPASEGPSGPGSLPSQELPVERPQIVTSVLPEEPPVGPPPLALLEEPQEPEPSVEMFMHPDGVKRPYPPEPEITGPVGALTPLPEEPIYGPSAEYNAPVSMPQTRDDQTATPYIPPGLEAAFLRMQGKSPEQLAAKEQATAETKTEREVLSNLLQNNQFDEAFKYAKDNNVQNLLIDPTELKTLRGPFSNDEMKSFFSAMPKDLMGEHEEREVKFTPDKALEQSLKVAQIPKEGIALGPLGELIGYPDVQRAFEPQELVKEMTLFDKLIRAAVYAGVAYAGGTALAGIGGAGGAGAAGAGGAGAGAGGGLSSISSAVKSVLAIPETIGIKIGEALGYNTLSTLQAKMIGNAVISGGVTGAKGGDLEDVLKSAAMAAGLTFVSDKVIKAVTEAVQNSGLLDSASKAGDALQSGVETIDDATASNITQSVVDKLDQINVITNTASTVADAATTLTSVAASQPSAKEPEVKVETKKDQIEAPPSVVKPPLSQETSVEEPTATKEEVKVETEKDQPTTPVVTEPTPKSPIDEAAPEKPEEEVKVETEREPETPPVVTTKPPLDEVKVETEREPKTPPVVTTKPPLDEVKVETEREPETPPVVTTKPPLDEVKVETKREPVVDDLIIPPITIPTTTPVDLPEPKINEPNPLKDLLDKYGSLENLLKLLGALGSAASGGGTSPTMPTLPTGGMGGALPKYTFTRKQLSPDIDYYTYGFRPEAKFFEDTMQLEKPVQPPLTEPPVLPPATLPDEDKVMATGGLTGYAKGGSNKSRYVAGPGSGRDDKIPALLSDGEYVIDAETLALLGDGSTKEGARRMDEFRANIRRHKGRALSRGRISPNAKSPSNYMGGGLT